MLVRLSQLLCGVLSWTWEIFQNQLLPSPCLFLTVLSASHLNLIWTLDFMTPSLAASGPFETLRCLHLAPELSLSTHFGSHLESRFLQLHRVGSLHAASTSTSFSPYSATWQILDLWESSLVILANIYWVHTKHSINFIKPCEPEMIIISILQQRKLWYRELN